MHQVSPGVTGRKSGPVQSTKLLPSTVPPLLVSVMEARRLLGMSKNKFWLEARAGKFEIVGSERKRYVVFKSLQRYVDGLPRRNATEQQAA